MTRSLKDILTAQVEETSAMLNEAAEADVDLKVAMTQTITEQSITVQNYRIDIISEQFAGREKNFYNVVDGKEIIHSDLALFETAMGIVKGLLFDNDSKVNRLLELDNRYASSLQEAATYKMKCKTIVESSKHDIAMAKQGAAVYKMKEIKKQIKSAL